jgi:DNA-binding CsgD family transcriptional regulator
VCLGGGRSVVHEASVRSEGGDAHRCSYAFAAAEYLHSCRLEMGTELLERESHLDALAWWWDEAVAGEGRLVFVGGEAGAGKTSLVRRFRNYVPTGAWVLAGDCEPLATPVPLGPLLDMAPGLPGLDDVLTRGPSPVEARRAFLQAVDTVRAGSLVIVEDAHWADEATLDLLRYVGRRLAGKRVMVVVTYRDDEVGPRHPLRVLMGDMATLDCVRRLSVGPLSREAVTRLAQGSGLDAGTLHRRTGGNPFFVTEILRVGEAVVPATVRDAVLARVARLSEPALELVEATACLGARVAPRLVQEVTGRGPDVVDDCLAAGVLLCEDDELVFGHELAREAVAQAVPPPRAAHYHARALRALEALPEGTVDPARMAVHAESSGDRGALLRYARAAGDQASRLGAHREAAAHYRRALSVAEGLADDERAGLFEAAALACFLSHELERSIEAAHAALEIWRALGDHRRQGRALLLLFNSYLATPERIPRVEDLLREAVAVLERVPPSPELVTAWQARAALWILGFRPDEARRAAERAAAVAGEMGDAQAETNAGLWTGLARVQGGDQTAWPLVHESTRAILAEGVSLFSPKAAFWPYHVAVTQRRHPVADRLFTDGMAFINEHDVETIRQFFLSYRARELLERGRWDEAEALATRPLASAGEDGFRLIAQAVVGRLKARRGDPGALAVLEEVARCEVPARPVVEWILRSTVGLAELAWLSGEHEAVIAHLEPTLGRAVELGEPWWLGEVAFWLWRVDALERPPAGMAEPYALLLGGRSREAHDAWLAIGCPYEAAQALSCADDEAALRQALDVFDRFGARGERDAVARRLRGLGVRHIPRTRRPPGTAPGTPLLSPREAEVLALVEEGLRNAEIAAKLFLSERTVEHHVASVLRKLQAHSRVDAVSKARSLGLLVDA